MPALPPQLANQVFANLFDAYALLCCSVSHSGKIEKIWGNATVYGLNDLEIGTRITSLPYLLGMPMNEEWHLQDVETDVNQHCDIHFSPNIDGQKYLIFITTEKMIARRRDDQQRGHELALVQQKNAQLIEQLEESKRLLAKESALKSKFIASMSHEFRTPLTSVLGYTQLLSELPNLSPDSHNHITAVERSSQHLLSLVENLLDKAHFETDSFELIVSETSLESLLEEVVSIIAPLAADKGLAFHAQIAPDCSKSALLDGVRLKQVLINILGNGVKFTQSGSISLSLNEKNNTLIFTLSDTGPGIEEENFEKMFSAFGRLDNTKASPGVGLGLNISARLIGLMHGSIDIESEINVGTSFIVSIPLVKATTEVKESHTQSLEQATNAEGTAAKSILLAEDNHDISELLSILLGRSGFAVSVAENGLVALDKIAQNNYDLILTDLHMPLMTGQELVKELRLSGYAKPIIALTASQKKNERIEMQDIGFTDMLSKPLQLQELLMTINKYLTT